MRRLAFTLAAVGLGIGLASVPAVAASAATTQNQSQMTVFGMQNPGQNGQNAGPGQNGQNPNQSGQCQNGTSTGPQCSVNLDSEVSGPFSGTSSFNVSPSCSFLSQVYNASYTSSTGTGSFSLNGCVLFSGSITSFGWSGTFSLVAPDGATLQGTVAGSVDQIDPSNPLLAGLTFTLTPTSGTNEFANATGAINLTGTWDSTGKPGIPGPISGSLSAALM